MTRFTEERHVMMGNRNLTVMIRPSVPIDALVGAAGDALRIANVCLDRTLQALTGQLSIFQRRWATQYFRTGPDGFDRAQLVRAKTVFRVTRNGLSSDVTIKTGNNVGGAGNAPLGVVGRDLTKPVPKAYHTNAVKMDDDQRYTYGAIRLDSERLQSNLGAQTLIHEATHKYAGTIDNYYFGSLAGATDGGYATLLPNADKALENADSYAWFAWYVGKGGA